MDKIQKTSDLRILQGTEALEKIASDILNRSNPDEIKGLISNLFVQNRGLQKDSFTLLKWISEREPKILIPFFEDFIKLLKSDYNRMRWGSMQIIRNLNPLVPHLTYSHLEELEDAVRMGSIVEQDQWVDILVDLSRNPSYYPHCFALLADILWKSGLNQFPTYIEELSEIVQVGDIETLVYCIGQRISEPMNEAKKRRLEKSWKILQARKKV